jgi:iron complex transport system ATP-binding protein
MGVADIDCHIGYDGPTASVDDTKEQIRVLRGLKMHINGLSYTYQSKGSPTLKDITLCIDKGAITALFGPNGSGKTTLLKCMTGVAKYSLGSIKVGSIELSSMNYAERSKMISYVSQMSDINVPFSVWDIVMMGRYTHLSGLYPKQSDIEITNGTLAYLGLSEIEHEIYTELSGGQKQLVNIARAVNQATEYIVLDEPASGLDYANAHMVWSALRNMTLDGRTIVISSHDPNHVLRYCDKVVILKDGTVSETGAPSQVMTEERMKEIFDVEVDRGSVGGREMMTLL